MLSLRTIGATLLALGFGSAAFAQPAIIISDETVAPGGSTNVSLDFQADGTVTQLNFRFTYDPTVLTADITNCGGGNETITPGNTSCNIPDPGEIAVVHGQLGTTPLSDGTFGSVQFTADAGASPQTVPLAFSVQSFSNASGDAVAPNGSQEGSVTISAPAGDGFYASTPDAGGNLDFGMAEVGSAATPADTLNVQNLSPDTDFDITGFNEPSGGGVLNFPGTPITVPFGGNVDVNISCTPSSRGDNGGNFEVVHDSVNGAASPVGYTFDCAGLAPNVQLPADITINGTIAGADPTGTLTVTNPQDGFTSTANNVTAAAGAGDAEITVTTGGPTNIAPDGSFNFEVSCDSSAEGSFVRTIDFTWDDPAGPGSGSVDVTCNISDTAPVYESDPAVGTMLSMSSAFGTQSAPTGLDVRNGNPNTSADDLVINSATADDPVFSVTVNQTTFPPNGSFDGNDDIEVTCTPEGVGTVMGTLTVATNDPTEPAEGFTYPLECTGTGDVLSTSPDNGGTLNLGTVPPGDTTGEGFVNFTNNGISGSGDVDVSCTLTDPDGVFTSTTALAFTVTPQSTESAGFQCTPSEIASFNATLSCDFSGATTGTATFTLACAGRPLIVPTLSQWGLLVMMLSLLLAGGYAARRMVG